MLRERDSGHDPIGESLVVVDFDMPFSVGGHHQGAYRGVGMVVDVERGWVVADRSTVPEAIGDVSITFAAMKRREAVEAHVDKMRRILAANIQNKLGSRRVDAIRVQDIVRCLKPIWHEKPVLAKRAAMFTDQALTFARANGHEADISAANAKVLTRALGRQKRCVKHFRALSPDRVPAAYAAIAACSAEKLSKLALQFLILTAARPGEVCGMRLEEFEAAGDLWTIPAARMKAGVQHRVPLSQEAIALVEQAVAICRGRYVFSVTGKPLGDRDYAENLAARRRRIDGAWLQEFIQAVVPSRKRAIRSRRGGAGAPSERSGRAGLCTVGLSCGEAHDHGTLHITRLRFRTRAADA